MDRARQSAEVDRNYDAFVGMLPSIISEHLGQLALMRDGQIVAYYDTPGKAHRAGCDKFEDGIFSIQRVTDEPIDLGFWSAV